jgi:tRNA-Thr(GGU) m(6)t(6)A37 methyltransferase TsaA
MIWIVREMIEKSIIYRPIGHVQNDFDEPCNPKAIRNSLSTLVIDPEYAGGMDGLNRYKYILVVFHMDRASGYKEKVHPMGDPSIPERGVFATRSPARPNPIGITVVEVLSIEERMIKVTGLDALNGTPVIDIKPYEEHFDSPIGVEREKDPEYEPCVERM